MKLCLVLFILPCLLMAQEEQTRGSDSPDSEPISRVSNIDHKSLYLNVESKYQYFASDVLKDRVKAGLKAVEKSGKLIVEIDNYLNSRFVFDLMMSLSEKEKSKLILLESGGGRTPWIRDSSPGWSFDPETGNYSMMVQPKESNSKNEKASHMNSLLYLCQESKIGHPKIMSKKSFIGQGGDIVPNGAGLCVVGENTIRGCKEQKNNTKTILETLNKEMNCKDIIEFPCDMVQMGHVNGHADLGVSFLNQNLAIVPEISDNCENEMSARMKVVFDNISEEIIARGINVERIPAALGCINREKSRMRNIDNIKEEDFITNDPQMGNYTLRTYSNAVVMEDSIIIPKYLPPKVLIDKNEKKVKFGKASKELMSKYDKANEEAFRKIKELQARGLISAEKKIIQMPVTHDNVTAGGAVRCLSLTIPVDLNSCTTERIEEKLKEETANIQNINLSCDAVSVDSNLCSFAENMFRIGYRLQQAEIKRLKFIKDGKTKEKIDSSVFKKMSDALYKLKNDLKAFCNKAFKKARFYFSQDEN